jgi:hypothetical protein
MLAKIGFVVTPHAARTAVPTLSRAEPTSLDSRFREKTFYHADGRRG